MLIPLGMAEWCIPFWVTFTLTLTSDLISRFLCLGGGDSSRDCDISCFYIYLFIYFFIFIFFSYFNFYYFVHEVFRLICP